MLPLKKEYSKKPTTGRSIFWSLHVLITVGRFGLSPACLFLFGSINEAYMPGIQVRYVEVRPQCLSPEVSTI